MVIFPDYLSLSPVIWSLDIMATYVKPVRNSASQAVCESAATSLHFGNSLGSWGNYPELAETVISEWREGVTGG